MKINLYYVEGISRIDTPSFNTKTHVGTIEDQEEFFLTKLVKSIDISFYPPHYQNSIKFDKDDLEITDNINYLSLEYNGKAYYYFIDKIDYTSTGIITLEVSMDTIQTFMFDIYISSGLIRRKFINRWKYKYGEYIINRDYCRENVSEGIFQLIEKKYFNKYSDVTDKDVGSVGNINGMFVFACTDNIGDDDPTGQWHRTETIKGLSYSSTSNYFKETLQFMIYVVPVIPNYTSITLTDGTNTAGCNYDLLFNKLLNDPLVYQAYFIPNDNKGFFSRQTGGNLFTGVNGIKVIRYEGQGLFAIHKDFYSEPLVKTFTHDYRRNYNTETLFNENYMPVLLDENYIRFEYGEGNQLSTVPLYYQCFSQFGLVYENTLLHGNRCYNIILNYNHQPSSLSVIIDTNSNYIGTPDLYNTAVACNDKIRLTLLTNAYKEWITYNKAAIPMAYVSTIANCFTYGIMNANNSVVHKNYTTSTSGERVHGFPIKKKTTFNYSTTTSTSDAPHYAPTNSSSLAGVATSQWNAVFAPPAIRFSGEYLNDYQNHSLQVSFNKHRVNDYKKCAMYYHMYGYLVNEYVTHIDNIFNFVKNRYYFDLIQGEKFEVHLHHVIEDEETVNQIESRLEDGLRLWNVKNNEVIIGDFTYDNVEYDYLS